jgi:hypothetical protein
VAVERLIRWHSGALAFRMYLAVRFAPHPTGSVRKAASVSPSPMHTTEGMHPTLAARAKQHSSALNTKQPSNNTDGRS